jgi:hypothetical protein
MDLLAKANKKELDSVIHPGEVLMIPKVTGEEEVVVKPTASGSGPKTTSAKPASTPKPKTQPVTADKRIDADALFERSMYAMEDPRDQINLPRPTLPGHRDGLGKAMDVVKGVQRPIHMIDKTLSEKVEDPISSLLGGPTGKGRSDRMRNAYKAAGLNPDDYTDVIPELNNYANLDDVLGTAEGRLGNAAGTVGLYALGAGKLGPALGTGAVAASQGASLEDIAIQTAAAGLLGKLFSGVRGPRKGKAPEAKGNQGVKAEHPKMIEADQNFSWTPSGNKPRYTGQAPASKVDYPREIPGREQLLLEGDQGGSLVPMRVPQSPRLLETSQNFTRTPGEPAQYTGPVREPKLLTGGVSSPKPKVKKVEKPQAKEPKVSSKEMLKNKKAYLEELDQRYGKTNNSLSEMKQAFERLMQMIGQGAGKAKGKGK